MLRAGAGERGFSLLELLVVLLLIGLSSLIVLPSIGRGLRKRELRQSALKLAATARTLRSRAVYENTLQRLILNPVENSYRIFRKKKVFLSSDLKITGIEGGEALGGGLKQFLFFPNGSALGGKIGISNHTGSASYTIGFDPLTGKVVVKRGRK
ncbi:MAG: prepilin-type N-terminal cleavage/methylation domain-containing protein [Candidatus Binatia bacterium]